MSKRDERLPEIDWDKVFEAVTKYANDTETGYTTAYEELRDVILTIQQTTFHVAQDVVFREGGATRAFLLNEKARWLDHADSAEGDVGRAVARFVANAYGEAAERLRRPDRPTLDDPSTDDLPSLEESSQDPDRCAHGFPMGLHCQRDASRDTPVPHVIVTQFCGLDDPHEDHGYGAGLDERWCPGT